MTAITLSDREWAICWLGGALGIVVGLWLGYSTVPAEAVASSLTTTANGSTTTAVLPAPPYAPALTVLVLGVAVWRAFVILSDDPADVEEQPADVQETSDDESDCTDDAVQESVPTLGGQR